MEARELFCNEALSVVLGTPRRVSFDDALLVVPQRERVVDEGATVDSGFDSIPGFRRIH